MNIAFLLPANFSLTGPGNGVRVQAIRQADALQQLGHDVVRMDPWQHYDLKSLDIIHFFSGGFPHFGIETGGYPLVWSPIIDTNESNRRYRAAAQLGQAVPKVYTIPGVFRSQAQKCKVVICRSTHEQERVVHGLGIQRERTAIVLNGVNPPGAADPDGIRRRLDLPEKFILHVSVYSQPRKNAARLAEAVGPTGIPLVFAGTTYPEPGLERLKQVASRYPNVRLLGFQDQQSLDSLYAACEVFALPSSHEGTGLAALEAASFGAKVVITRNGGTRDYFRDLAEYVNPDDVEDIRRAVTAAWERPKGDDLRRHVIEHLTWRRSAESLVGAYTSH